MKKDVKMLTEVLDIVSKKRKQINFDSNAARHQMAIEVVHELRKRRCQINKIELWMRKRLINTFFLPAALSPTMTKRMSGKNFLIIFIF